MIYPVVSVSIISYVVDEINETGGFGCTTYGWLNYVTISAQCLASGAKLPHPYSR